MSNGGGHAGRARFLLQLQLCQISTLVYILTFQTVLDVNTRVLKDYTIILSSQHRRIMAQVGQQLAEDGWLVLGGKVGYVGKLLN